jgi:hypothetical protein
VLSIYLIQSDNHITDVFLTMTDFRKRNQAQQTKKPAGRE